MKVYIILNKVPYEGQWVQSVHSTLENAITEMEKLMPNGEKFYNKHFNEYQIHSNYDGYYIQIEEVK